MSIEIVYHVAMINSWEKLIIKQLELLKSSQLLEACDRLTIVAVGSEYDTLKSLLLENNYQSKINLIYGGDLQFCEFPSIWMVKKIANEKNHASILYFHTKGISRTAWWEEVFCDFWRQYLEYFNIERWKDCLMALQTVDICGVDWNKLRRGYGFTGNFWWAKAGYIQSCKGIDSYPNDPQEAYANRIDCESFIGTGDAKCKIGNFFASNRYLLRYLIEPKEYRISPQESLSFQIEEGKTCTE